MINLKYPIDILFFLSPISYLYLGYYFFKKEFKLKPSHIILISLCVFIISTFLKMIIGNSFTEFRTLHTYIDIGFLQIIQACSVFIIIKHIYCNRNTGILLKIRNLLERDHINIHNFSWKIKLWNVLNPKSFINKCFSAYYTFMAFNRYTNLFNYYSS